MLKLTSKDNPIIKEAARLASSKKARDNARAFMCEGAKLVSDGADCGARPLMLFATEKALARYPALAQTARMSERAYLITDELAARLSDTDTPQGVFAVFKKLDIQKSADTIYSCRGPCVVLSRVSDPGNAGAVMRSCEALGAQGLILSPDCADVYSPKALRAGMGAVFRLPIVIRPVLEAVRGLRANGFTVSAAAVCDNAAVAGEYTFPEKSAVLIGNEGAGLSPEEIEACDNTVMIPMHGGAQSLNAAVAAGILIWEMTK
ncbi:MAG: RNA methyltransferase [Oscillospiraceae bacterium]|nr:RNA methyltransferase [Oscillospiraceae bacterium]